MSVVYNFKIRISKRKNTILSAIDVITSLMDNGWSLNSEKNEIIYTDVGDNDDFDFFSKMIEVEEYFNIVDKKQKNNEVISLAMFYLENDDRYRIDLIITPEFDILIAPDDATKKMLSSNMNMLDVNWYYFKLIPALTNEKMRVEDFSVSKF